MWIKNELRMKREIQMRNIFSKETTVEQREEELYRNLEFKFEYMRTRNVEII